MTRLRIAQAQINPTVGDLGGNMALIREYCREARQADADLITFPELALSGYPPEDLLLKPRFLKDVEQCLAEMAASLEGPVCLVGYPEAADGKVYNSAAVIAGGKVVGNYRKVELPNYGEFDEKRYFSPGSGCTVLDFGGVRLAVTICEDVWIEGGALERCAVGSCQGTVNISGSPFSAGKLAVRLNVLTRFAKCTESLICYNNLLGGQDELVFDGGSLVMNKDGEIIARARRFEETLLVTDLELAPVTGPVSLVESDLVVYLPSPSGNKTPLEDSCRGICTTGADMDVLEEVHKALILGTRDYVLKNGFKKVVLGLSGGIDSTLVAQVAVEALGRENVVGVTMPSQFTSDGTKSDAHLLAENLGIEIHEAPIQNILESYRAELTGLLGEGPLGLVDENLQARIRGNILMALSNRFGWLVLTTGNKSETAVGYCTLYGDMAGGFAVIKDVPKTLVYRICEYVNQKEGREVIPRSVIVRPPSAELRPDQKDEDSLPPYEVLDPLLKAYVEQDKVLDEIMDSGADPEALKKVIHLVDLNEYKRRQAPPGVKITPKAFGRDRRLPITNHYRPGLD